MLSFTRNLISVTVLACGLCSPAFADIPSYQGIDPSDLYFLGKALVDYAEGVLGDAEAQADLAQLYYYGYGVPRDYVEAVKWLRKAADQGNARAQTNLAFMYREGDGVPRDYAEAVKWYRKAADHGDAAGQAANLGYMYDKGKGVPRDPAEAMKWYRKAAHQGDADAQSWLGSHKGDAVPPK